MKPIAGGARLVSWAYGALAAAMLLRYVVVPVVPYGWLATAARYVMALSNVGALAGAIVFLTAPRTAGLRGLASPAALLSGFAVLASALPVLGGGLRVASAFLVIVVVLLLGAAREETKSDRGAAAIRAFAPVLAIGVVAMLVDLVLVTVEVFEEGPSVIAARISLVVHVVRPAAVAVLAALVARSASPVVQTTSHADGPYRAPDVAHDAGAARPRPPLTAASTEMLRVVERAFLRIKRAFFVQLGVLGGFALVFFGAFLDPKGATVFLLFVLLAFANQAIALWRIVALAPVSRLGPSSGLRGGALGAIVLLSFMMLNAIPGIAVLSLSLIVRGAGDRLGALGFIVVIPLSLLVESAVQMLLAMMAARIGVEIGDDPIRARARWVMGLSCAAVALELAALAMSFVPSGSGASSRVIVTSDPFHAGLVAIVGCAIGIGDLVAFGKLLAGVPHAIEARFRSP